MKNFLAIVFTASVISVAVISGLGYDRHWDWVGVSDYTSPQVTEGQEYQRAKTLWDWMELLIVPIALSGGAWMLSERQRSIEESQAEERRRQADYENYLAKVWEILEKYNSPDSLNNSDFAKSTLRAWTLGVLRNIDSRRKGNVIQYLYETGLIIGASCPVNLRKADLSGANLQGFFLPGINLSESNLQKANLKDAVLGGEFSINEKDLAKYISDDSKSAILDGLKSGKLLSAILTGADLTQANLEGSNLEGVVWKDAVLYGASMRNAKLNLQELQQVAKTDSKTFLPK
ncbi:MAG: pentapeptide repeat-containing protein [Tildeniella torsiva UHER 1998/13D]|nr:pentapeptide repeat-containing protein [Tildeniella torsiva UHER 1998/13D]